MKTHIIAIFLVLIHSMINSAWSADVNEESLKKKEACITQTKQRTAALVAQDWTKLDVLAERYVKTCKNVFDEQDYSTAYEHIAIASANVGNYERALAASNSCTDIYYSNSGCHLQQVVALTQLGRLSEARTSLEKVEKLIIHLAELTKRDLRYADSAIEKELYESRLYKYDAEFSHASAIRNRYFAQ